MAEPEPIVAEPPRPDVNAALAITGVIGGAIFTALIAGAGWVYGAVAEAGGLSLLDQPVLDWLVARRTPAGEHAVTLFTGLGRTLPMVLISLALTTLIYLRFRRRTAWVLMVLAAAGSVSFTLAGKAIVGRARPPQELAVAPFETDFSFPSGHTLNATVIAGMLAYLLVWLSSRLWVRLLAGFAAALWALAMGASRVFLGHHWLTDVAFGWLFGLAWLALLITAHRVYLHLGLRSGDRQPPPPPPVLAGR